MDGAPADGAPADGAPAQPHPVVAQDNPPPQAPETVHHIGLKIPPFWAADPAVWFIQVESAFSTRNITRQLTMYQHVVANISPAIAGEIRDILVAPLSATPYDDLKTALLGRTEQSKKKKLQALLTEEELGSRKPSQLLRRMQQLQPRRKPQHCCESCFCNDYLVRCRPL